MEIIPTIHSYWAYLVVLLTASLVLATLFYFFSGKKIDAIFRKLSLFTLISFHIQLLIGIATYFTSPILNSFAGLTMKEVMKNDLARLIKIEHPMMMISAVIFVTIANAKIKRSGTITKGILILVILTAIVLFSRIPYSLWFN